MAAALAACALGCQVILTEETDWLGGQLTSQAVPPDEHPWIESFGCTRRYRAFRDGVRRWFRDNAGLTAAAQNDPLLNPGGGYVSRLCFEATVGLAVIERMLEEFIAKGQLIILRNRKAIAADVAGERVVSVTFNNPTQTIEADFVLDATELGDLLALATVEHVAGAEPRSETHEPHAVDGPPQPNNVQAFTWCFALGYDPRAGESHDRQAGSI